MRGMGKIDERVMLALSGREKIKILLAAAGHTITSFSMKYDLWVHDVSRCLTNEKRHERVRVALATALKIPRKLVDFMIEDGAA